MAVTDREIVDVLLKQATPETAERMRTGAEGDSELRRRISEWERLLQDARPAWAAQREAQAQAVEEALAKLRQTQSEFACFKQATAKPSRLPRHTFALAAAAAVLVALGAGLLALLADPAAKPPSEVYQAAARTAPDVTAPVVYVDYAANRETDEADAAAPYRSLTHALDALPEDGGVVRLAGGIASEPMRISRPVRLEAASTS